MKSPNGYGSVSRLSGNRRKPYRVRVTTGFETDADGMTRQVQRTIGTYATYQEAVEALAAYNRNPLSIEPGITFAEIWRQWSAEKFETVGDATRKSYIAAYNAIPMLHDMEFRKLRRNHLQNAIDTCGKNLPTLINVRIVISQLYRYALQNDVIEKDYSRFIDLTRHKPKDDDERTSIHTDFKQEEIAVLWERADFAAAPELLMLIYSGLRISEYLALTPEDIDIEARFVTVRKSKTAAGRRRVPIARKTLPLWTALRAERETAPDTRNAAQKYRDFLTRAQTTLSAIDLPDHLPHDTRHTTATLLHNAHVDPLAVKRILGHAVTDVTEGVYTHLSDDAMLNAIDAIG